jgi:hypothetical protein
MKRQLPKGILSAAVIAARVICSAQSNVYSANIVGGGESQLSDVSIWNSSDLPVKWRAEAASRLAPIGTKQADVERILGHPSHAERYISPVVHLPGFEGSTSITNCNVWCDIYKFSGGDYVCLDFDVGASGSRWEDRPLLDISIGNTTNNVRIAINPKGK